MFLQVKSGIDIGLSPSSMSRIKRSRDYDQFKEILVKDRGPLWRSNHTIKDNRKWWEKLLNV